MAVDIDIDLDIGEALAKIEALRGDLESLDDIDTDLDDLELGDIGDQLGDVADQMEDISRHTSKINDDLAALNDLDDIDVKLQAPDGSTGSGDGGTDPPRQVTIRHDLRDILNDAATADGGAAPSDEFDAFKTARRIESRFGLNRGAIDPKSLGDLSIDELNAKIARFYHDRQGSSQRARNLGINSVPSEFRLGGNGLFSDDPEFRDLVSQMKTGAGFMAMKTARDAGELPDMDLRAADADGEFKKHNIRGLNDRFNRFGNSLRRLKPSMRKFWNLLAMVLPLIVALGVQAVGVGAALGGVAAAGAAVIGLGLIGHADSMGAAFENAKERVAALKQELFEVFQPAAKTFAPIQARFFDVAPAQIEKIADEMEGLESFDDTIFAGFAGLTDFLAEFIAILADSEEAVSQLAMRFGGLIGSTILDFFEWLITMTSQNQDILVRLGVVFKNIGIIIWNVSMAVAKFAAILLPVFQLMASLSDLLNGALGVGLIAGILAVWALSGALSFMVGVLNVAQTEWMMNIAVMLGFEATTWGAVAATLALAAALSAVTFGAAAILGGASFAAFGPDIPPPSAPGDDFGGPPRGGGSTVVNYNSYQINHQGEMSTDSEQRIRSTIEEVQREEAAGRTPRGETKTSDSNTGWKWTGI